MTKKAEPETSPNALHVENMEGFEPPEPQRSIDVWDLMAAEEASSKSTKKSSPAPATESGE